MSSRTAILAKPYMTFDKRCTSLASASTALRSSFFAVVKIAEHTVNERRLFCMLTTNFLEEMKRSYPQSVLMTSKSEIGIASILWAERSNVTRHCDESVTFQPHTSIFSNCAPIPTTAARPI